MIGIVNFVDPVKKFARISLPGAASLHGTSPGIFAPFSEIKNAEPQVYDFAEIVSFVLKGDGANTRAADARILVGKSERKALAVMRWQADGSLRRGNDTQRWSRDKDQPRPKPRPGTKRSGKGGHFVWNRFAVTEPEPINVRPIGE